MLMLCWLYCVPFANFMYYAAAPLLTLLSFFIFKRGICRNNLWLRRLALFLIFLSSYKIFLIDLQEISTANIIIKSGFVSLFILSLSIIYIFFKKYGASYISKPIKKKDDKDLRIWANTAVITTIILLCWEALPWFWYLSIGSSPEIFHVINWRLIALFNFVVLIVGFWLSEEYYWFYYKSKHGRRQGAARVWVPGDTLWLTLPLYLIALGAGVMSDDILQ